VRLVLRIQKTTKQRFFHAEFLRLTVAKHAIRSEVNKTNQWKFHRITAGDGQK
jgi:hypothetical protein